MPRRQWHHLYRRQLVDGLCCATGLRPGEAEADVYSKPIALISTIIGIGMAFACGASSWSDLWMQNALAPFHGLRRPQRWRSSRSWSIAEMRQFPFEMDLTCVRPERGTNISGEEASAGARATCGARLAVSILGCQGQRRESCKERGN